MFSRYNRRDIGGHRIVSQLTVPVWCPPRTVFRRVTSEEWEWLDSHEFTYAYDWACGEIKRVGADAFEMTVFLDMANRVSSVVRRD